MASHTESLHWRAVFAFGIASLLTVALGTLVMAQADVPLGIWIRNPIAWLVAAGTSLFLAARGWLGSFMVPVAIIVLALSFLGPDQQGVHRWLGLGPIQFNAAALVLPVAIAAFMRTSARVAIPCFAVVAILLAWQPDVSQLAAFALAAIILAAARFRSRGAVIAIVIAGAAIAICLSRPDPLAPVPHVEGIFTLAFTLSPGIALAMTISLATASLSPLLLASRPDSRWPAFALASYFAVTGSAFLFGAYPVPLAGYGLSFVIGWWLGFACLSVRRGNQVNSLTSA